MSEAVMGIDPGVRGGLAIIDSVGELAHVSAFRPSMTRVELVGVLGGSVDTFNVLRGTTCYLEKVGFIKGDGGKGAFTFGRIVGLIEAALITYGINVIDVYPMRWQAHLNCLTGGNKNITKNKAASMFPKWNSEKTITHSTADAILIASYGWDRMNDRGLG